MEKTEQTIAAQLHQNMDADFWAKEFMEVRGKSLQELDLDLMRGWFANAIMCGWDHAHWDIDPELNAAREVVEAVRLYLGDGHPDVLHNALAAYDKICGEG